MAVFVVPGAGFPKDVELFFSFTVSATAAKPGRRVAMRFSWKDAAPGGVLASAHAVLRDVLRGVGGGRGVSPRPYGRGARPAGGAGRGSLPG